MKYIPGSIAAVVLPVLIIAGACSSQAQPVVPKTPEQIKQETRDFVFRNLWSACDEHGHRIYKYRVDGWRETSIAVVPNDSTCKETA